MATTTIGKPNLAVTRILRMMEAGDFEKAHQLIRERGTLIGSVECGITFHRFGDDVLCVRAYSQANWSGKLSSEPYFKAPVKMECHNSFECSDDSACKCCGNTQPEAERRVILKRQIVAMAQEQGWPRPDLANVACETFLRRMLKNWQDAAR